MVEYKNSKNSYDYIINKELNYFKTSIKKAKK